MRFCQSPSTRPIMRSVLLLALVALCCAQEPTPCESPKQWEGRRLLMDQSKKFTEIAGFALDETNMRLRAIDEEQQGTERNFYDTLVLWKENKEYRVDLRTKKCNVTTPREPFRPVSVPANAKFQFEAEIGPSQIPNEHFTIAAFAGNFTRENVAYVTTVTLPDCIPVATNLYSEKIGFVEARFYDVKIGISDPEAFIPPSECMQPEGVY